MEKALQLILLLVQDNIKIIVLFGAAAASGTFKKEWDSLTVCVVFLFLALEERKP